MPTYSDVPVLPGKEQDQFFDPRNRSLTVPWIYFFEQLRKKLTEIINNGANPDTRVVVLEDTNTGAKAIPLVQDRDIELQWAAIIIGDDSGNTGELKVDVSLDGVSIFGDTKLVVPAGSPVRTVVTQDVFLNSPQKALKNQIWGAEILEGDGSCTASVIIAHT